MSNAIPSNPQLDINLTLAVRLFPSIIVPTHDLVLSKSQCQSLLEYSRFQMAAQSALSNKSLNDISFLQLQLDSIIKAMGGMVFIKCGRKSCVDHVIQPHNRFSTLTFSRFISQAHDYLIARGALDDMLCDDVLNLWVQAMGRSMLITNGNDLIRLLCSSLQASYALTQSGTCHLYIRKFIEVDPSLQFRAYIVRGRMTGLTQKYSLESRFLLANAHEIEQKIMQMIDNILTPGMKTDLADNNPFVADFFIIPKRKEKFSNPISIGFLPFDELYGDHPPEFQVLLSQLQPFTPRSVVGLFKWSIDQGMLLGWEIGSGPKFRFKNNQKPSNHDHHHASKKIEDFGNIGANHDRHTATASHHIKAPAVMFLGNPQQLKLDFEEGSPLVPKLWLEKAAVDLTNRVWWRRFNRWISVLSLVLLCLAVIFMNWLPF